MKKFLRELSFFIQFISKRKLLFFFFATIFMAFLDLSGIASVGAFVSILVQGESSSFVGFLKEEFSINLVGNKRYVLFVGSGLLGIFTIKTLFSCFLQKWILSITNHIEIAISSKLGQVYINMPYEDFMQKDRAFVENLLYNGGTLSGVLGNLLQFFTNSIIFFSISSFLFYTFPFLFISFFIIFFLCAFFYYVVIKRKIEKAERDSIDGSRQYIRSIKDVFSSFKEIKIYDRGGYFLNVFSNSLKRKSKASLDQQFYKIVPRFLIELFLIFFIVLTSFALFYLNNSVSYVLQSLGVFAASFSRLLPVINLSIANILHVKSSRLMLSLYYDEIKGLEESFLQEGQKNTFQKESSAVTEIFFNKINYSYPLTEVLIFENFSLKISRNECLGIIGESGSGKSTFVDLLTGIITPQKGQILVDGQSVFDDLKGWRSHFAYIPQNVLLIDNTIANNIALGIEEGDIDQNKIREALKLAELLDFVERLPEKTKTVVGENGMKLSGGQRQRVALARAFYQERDILILDEATSALDPVTEKKIFETLKFIKNKTLIIISHNHEVLNICDKIYDVRDKNIKLNENPIRSQKRAELENREEKDSLGYKPQRVEVNKGIVN